MPFLDNNKKHELSFSRLLDFGIEVFGEKIPGKGEDSYNRLDAAQDAVNSKIGELRAKKLEMIPIMNALAIEYQALKTEVQNALN